MLEVAITHAKRCQPDAPGGRVWTGISTRSWSPSRRDAKDGAGMSGRASRTREASTPTPRTSPATDGVIVCAATVAALAAAVSVLATTGSDAFWPVALGNHIRVTGAVPVGVPFAAAPTAAWVNTTVLGQLTLSIIGSLGSVG